MQNFQQRFIQLAIDSGALKFGEFKLKSGRSSPYFFNAGEFNSGSALAALGSCYAEKIVESGLEFDMLFGPAYKGIPLVAVTAASLARDHNIDVPYAFNRKEAKAHGEGGNLVGAPLSGRVLIVDDVITAGTAIREVIAMLSAAGVAAAGVVIGLDRKEKGADQLSAIKSFERDFNVPVESIITIEHLLEYLSNIQTGNETAAGSAQLEKMTAYWNQYGAI